MSSENVRFKLLERASVTPEAAALYDALLAQRGVVPNMFKTLAYSPDIAKGVAGFLKPLLSDGALPGWYKELIAVRISMLANLNTPSERTVTPRRRKALRPPRSLPLLILKMGPSARRKRWVFAWPGACMAAAFR